LILARLVFRAHHPRWAFAPDSGAGVAIHGGRYNPPGLPTLYTSLRLETAWLEAQQAFPFKAQPMTMCAYDVNCADILDLTDPGVRETLDMAPDQLSCAWEALAGQGVRPPGWTLAERLIGSGVAGILVPSRAAGAGQADTNAVFWHWSPASPHQVRVVDDLTACPSRRRFWPGPRGYDARCDTVPGRRHQ
jgi:RES domain-containing protein